MAVAAEALVRDKLYIGGEWVEPAGDGTIDVVNPSTEEVVGRVPEGTAEDADRAVLAARAAFDSWSSTPAAERAEYLGAIGAKLGERGDELAALISTEMGMPLKLSRMIQVGLPTATFSLIPQLVQDVAWEEKVGNSLIVREAAGVVGAITPWNYPLHQIANKVAAALAAGCTVVLKPSEVVPLNAFVLAEIVEEVGLPAGAFNLVTGTGPVVGEAIVAHPQIDMVSFTGSTRAGRRVSELAAKSVKPVTLELGGKSPNVILDDADLERAVPDGVAKCFLNSGQTCSALTRMLVPRDKVEEVERIAAAAAEQFTPGDPFDDDSRLGPLVSAAQLERVRGYIEKGTAEGARLVTGGAEPPEGQRAGLLREPDRLLRRRAGHDDRAGGDLRARPVDHPLRRRGGRGPHRQRLDLRAGRGRLVGRRGAGAAGGRAHPHRAGRDQRRRLQSARPVRRLQAVGSRPGERAPRARGVPRGEVSAALSCRSTRLGRVRTDAIRNPLPGLSGRVYTQSSLGLSVVRDPLGSRLEVGFAARLFFDQMPMEQLHNEIEERLAAAEPEVELLACERAGAERLRLVIDHPRGVDLALCERVSGHLRDLLVDYGIEVSSPGPRRPLTKPDHFRRFLGQRAKLRLRQPREGHRSVVGELVGASEAEVTVAADDGVLSIPYTEINKSNLLETR